MAVAGKMLLSRLRELTLQKVGELSKEMAFGR